MVDRDVALDLGRSLLVGVVIAQIRARTTPAAIGLGLVAVAALVGAILLDGGRRAVLIVIAIAAAVFAIGVLLLRRIITAILGRIAAPANFDQHKDALEQAIERLELPTGPVSGLRFAWGLRDGVDDEIARADDVITDLRQQLDL